MQEKQQMERFHGFLQGLVYALIILEASLFILGPRLDPATGYGMTILHLMIALAHLPIYASIWWSKLTVFAVICLSSIGAMGKKKVDLNIARHIIIPLLIGIAIFFGS